MPDPALRGYLSDPEAVRLAKVEASARPGRLHERPRSGEKRRVWDSDGTSYIIPEAVIQSHGLEVAFQLFHHYYAGEPKTAPREHTDGRTDS